MRFIHISDLHLGKRLNGFSLIEDQDYIIRSIINIIEEEKPDGVLIAGDIYDKAVPSEEAVRLWDFFLVSLSKLGVKTYVISGNHDSAVRLSSYSSLIEEEGIYLSPVYDGNARKLTLTDEFGPLNIYLLPFIKPATVRNLFPEETIENYTDACRVAVEQMNVNETERNILVAHQFVTGASRCDSEQIVVGGIDNVDATVFDVFDYVALGHIHGKQRIGRDSVRYSGTPLKYSLSEKDHIKSVTILDIKSKEDINISERPLVPLRDVREIRGAYDELMLKSNYEGTDVRDYLSVVLTDEDDIPNALARLRNIYPNIMKLSYDNARTRENRTITDTADVEKKSPLELFEEFYETQNNQQMKDVQREYVTNMINKLWEE
ncbi:exonuclease SbcCD subunit D [Eubacterium xylanophilum]|uniref:exonuclease SbcCD subunit D n=1 Tax=Eubacterium xylanophilum TaxID=39497 RepID=UPI000479EFE4|nr:exonuclease SbcCD subunit D [Eubacterium xylanophilum]